MFTVRNILFWTNCIQSYIFTSIFLHFLPTFNFTREKDKQYWMKLIPRPRLLSYYQFQKLSRTMVRTKLQLTQIEFSDTANVKSFLNCLYFNRDLKLVSFFKLKVLASMQRVYFEQSWFELSRNSNEALLIKNKCITYTVQIS